MSCTSIHQAADIRPVYLVDSNPVTPLAPAAMEKTRNIEQIIEARYRSDIFGLMAYVTLSDKNIEVVALTELGIQAYSLKYDTNGLRFNSLPNLHALVPEYVLFDFQLCYSDEKKLGEKLRSAGYQFIHEEYEAGWKRTVIFDGEIVYTIIKNKNVIVLSNIIRDYEYNIQENDI